MHHSPTQVDEPIQIIVKKDRVTIITTKLSERWLIYMNVPHSRTSITTNTTRSVGRGEGDTLKWSTPSASPSDKTTIDQIVPVPTICA